MEGELRRGPPWRCKMMTYWSLESHETECAHQVRERGGPRTEPGLPSTRGLVEREAKTEGREWRRNSWGRNCQRVRAITHVKGAKGRGRRDPSDLAAARSKLLPLFYTFFEYFNSL